MAKEAIGALLLELVQRRHFEALYLLLGVPLDGLKLVDVFASNERNGFARTARATGPSDAVHIVLGIKGQVVVDD